MQKIEITNDTNSTEGIVDVVKAAENEPEKYAELLEQMDEMGLFRATDR